MKTIYLVQCVKSKLEVPAPAKDFYMLSDLFRKSRAFVEYRVAENPAAEWFILSTKYGLTAPDQELEWYNLTFRRHHAEDIVMTAQQRREWTARVIQQMEERQLQADRAVFLASEHYLGADGRIMEWFKPRCKEGQVLDYLKGMKWDRKSFLNTQNDLWAKGKRPPEGGLLA